MATKPPIVPLGSPPASENDFRIHSVKPDVRFLNKAVQPPSQVYVSTNDVLVIACASSQALETITVSYRLLRFDGRVIMGQFVVPITLARIPITQNEVLTEGFLLSLSCKASMATTRGQTFVRAFITDPALGAGQPSYMLMADYVTTQMAPAHPNGRVLSPVEGPGFLTGYQAAAVGPGTEIQINSPSNTRWRIITCRGILRCSGVVANRYALLTYTPGGLGFFAGGAAAVQTAGVQMTYNAAAVTPYIVAGTNQNSWPLPPYAMHPNGSFIATLTQNLDPGDQWLSLLVGVEEWLDNV
jgi:hypothetical protein